ncbi:MAG: hypothetical protein E6Q88_10835 [Lysobacteraceae bacterium]|nr:MAG: hypothetical protein E6Q88_10835 [Xanthomonadaceae bacterium]
MNIRHFSLLAVLVFGLAATAANAATRTRVATDESGKQVKVNGSIVIIEPDIELSIVLAGGMNEPRKEWSDTARRLFPAAVHGQMQGKQSSLAPDYDIPDDLDPTSQLGQVIRLYDAVAMSIAYSTMPGSVLATKKDAKGKLRMDWSLGPGVSLLREQTGADYALFTYIRDSYTSGGRAALRVIGFLMTGGADIGGGTQFGVTALVDLRTGQVVWHNMLAKQTGDLRTAEGAKATVRQLLNKIPVE